LAPAVIVSMVEPEAGSCGAAKLALAFAGNPVTLSATFPLKPFCAAVITEYDVDWPGDTVAEAGEAEIVKSDPGVAAFTVSGTASVCVIAPLVAVTVSDELPAGVEAPAVIVSVVVPLPVMLAGLKLAVAPAGSPVTDNATAPLNPFVPLIVICEVALAPS
jgi:hypothetical protein